MSVTAWIEAIGLVVALAAAAQIVLPTRRRRLGRMGPLLLALAGIAALLHLCDYLQWRGHESADRLGDMLRVLLPVLWATLAYDIESTARTSEASRRLGQFRLLLDQASHPTVLLDDQAVILDCSDSFLFRSGCLREEIVGRRVATIGNLPRTVIERAWRQALQADGAIHSDRSETTIWAGEAVELDWGAQRWLDPDQGHPAGVSVVLEPTGSEPSPEEESALASARTIATPIQGLEAGGETSDSRRAAAHDLRNFLQIITGQAELLSFELDLQHRENLLSISRAGASAFELVRALSGPSRSEPLKTQILTLAELVEDTVDLIKPTLRANIKLVFDNLAPEAAIEGDRVRLQRVLVNLLLNAAEAMPRGGVISVRLAVRDGSAQLQVIDDGVGIPDEFRERIFDRYFSTKSPGENNGIGLSVVREVVEEHRGRVQLGPKRDQGSEFIVTLPLAVEAHWADQP
ncbi:MAG: HAMP domain-containing histidine kinase [Planctomycetes bacterium]|nr:HAMP domain-containing histidine kinase [Planctomycetota bacterium]